MTKAGNSQIMRTITLLITIFSLSFPAYAQYSGGTGEPNDPYQIATAGDLMLLGETPEDYDKHFILTADIDLDPNLPGCKVFDKAVIAPNTSSLDFQGTPFTGVFNGNGHTISHLTIAGDSYLGLFGLSVSGAKISNLGLDAENVNGIRYVGGLVGKNGDRYRTGGVLANCYSTGAVSGEWFVGGLIGDNADGSVGNCYSKVTIRGDRFVGGLVGSNSGNIENSYSVSKFEGYFTDVGGLVGDLSVIGPTFSNVTGSFWDKEVSGLSELPPSATNRGGTGLTTNEMKDINTFLDAEWDLYGNGKDGLEDHWFIQEGNYPVLTWQTKTTGLVKIPDVAGMAEDEARACLERAGFLRSDADQADYDGSDEFDKGDVLSTIPPSYAPIGADVAVLLNLGPYDWSLNSGNGTPANPYRIASAGQLESLIFHNELNDADFVLTKDIDMIRKSYAGPLIGRYSWESFTGKFDGRGHCIKNLTIKAKANVPSNYKYCVGLFGVVGEDAEIRALELKDASVNCVSDNVSIGILAGLCKGRIVDCHAGGRVDGSSNAGGLIGETTEGYVIGCSATSVVYAGERTGGLVGRNGGNIYCSYAAGIVIGSDDVGGLVGVNDGFVNNCYSSGQITASKDGEYVGGLIGRNWMEHQGQGRGPFTYYVQGYIENCYTTASVFRTIKPGGLLGAGANEYILSSYYLVAQDDDISDNGLGTPLTHVQIQDSNSFVGWDFVDETVNGPNDVWKMWDGYDYPRLIWEPGPNTPLVFVDINDPGFYGQMSKYEVTNAQYCDFLNAALASGDITVNGTDVEGASGSNTGTDYAGQLYYNSDGSGYTGYGATNGGASRIHYSEGAFNVDNDFGNHPVTYVSWYGAMAFANYYGYYLPTEDQWQAVADYDGTYIYGCGETIDPGIANYRPSEHPDGTTSVGSFGQYGYDMSDMAGNVWEWTSSSLDSSRIFRGGSLGSIDDDCAVSIRGDGIPYAAYYDIGFRVCR